MGFSRSPCWAEHRRSHPDSGPQNPPGAPRWRALWSPPVLAVQFHQRLAIAEVGRRPEADEHHLLDRGVGGEKPLRFAQRDARRPFQGKAVGAGADGGKGDRLQLVLHRQREAVAVATGQEFILVIVSVAPDRPDRVDDELRRQPIALRDLGLAGGAAAQFAAFRDELRARRPVDRPIDAAPAQQRAVGRVDDDIHLYPGDVAFDDLDARRLGWLAFHGSQFT